ncbi:uncharacterized protein LOC134236623 [Saccostrea cucullata]|uniref:uncharacterized protein LOC134236623 n=1 Tax=Saccostrea cuccullata TaxID=36930 RepID=UPI002ED55ECC
MVQKLTTLISRYRNGDQLNMDLHEEVLKNGVEEIQKSVVQLQKDACGINLETANAWTKGKELIEKSLQSLQFLLEILQSTEDEKIVRFRQSKDILPKVMDITEAASDMVNKLFVKIARNFPDGRWETVINITKIPSIIDDILGFMTPEDPTDLSDSANIEGVQPSVIKTVRIDLFKKCVTFSKNVCATLSPVLKELRETKSRSKESFKPFLNCILKQFLFLQRSSALLKELINFSTDTEWKNQEQSYLEFFKQIKHILLEGKRIICCLCPADGVPSDFQVVIPPKCTLIKECTKKMGDFQGRSKEELNSVLKDIEVACDGISKASEFGEKCLPPGEQFLGEDVSVMETGSDFDPDSEISVTKASIRDIEEATKDTSILPTEVVGVYKMNNIHAQLKVKIDHKRPLVCSQIKGQIIENGKKSRVPVKNIIVDGTTIGLSLTKGDFLLLLYDFPVIKKTIKQSELKNGEVTVDVPGDASCSVTVSKKDIQENLNLTYAVQKTDKDRIEGYKEESPEEFGMIDILDGIYLETSVNGVESKFNFIDNNKTEESSYFKVEAHMDGATKKRKWTSESFNCQDESNGKLSVPISLKTITYVVMVCKDIPVPDNDSNFDKSKLVREKTLTLLGIKSKCKALILYRFPYYEDTEGVEEVEDGDEVEVHVECIESQRYFLNERANILRENGKWIQFEDGDESADFKISEGSSLEVDVKGSAKIAGHYPAKKAMFSFLKNSSCFIELPVEVVISEKKKLVGYIYCNLPGMVLHWRRLPWMEMKTRYKDAMKSKVPLSKEQRKKEHQDKQAKQKTKEIGVTKGIESLVNEIIDSFTEEDVKNLKKEEKMPGSEGESLVGRLIGRVNKEKDKLRYLMNVLRKIGRNDLVQELTERVEQYGMI